MNFLAAILLTLIFFFPFSKLLDWLYQKVGANGQRRTDLVSAVLLVLALFLMLGGLVFALGAAVENPLILRMLGEKILSGQDAGRSMSGIWGLRFLLMGGIPLLVGSLSYWFLLQTFRKILAQRINLPHLFASVGNIFFLTILSILIYSIFLFSVKFHGDPAELVPYSNNLLAAILFTPIFFFPFSRLLDWAYQKVGINEKHRIDVLAVILLVVDLLLMIGGLALAVGITFLDSPVALQIIGGSVSNIDRYIVTTWLLRFLFLGGIPFWVGSLSYWILLQISRDVLSKRQEKQAISAPARAKIETKLFEALPVRKRWKFLAQWLGLNLLGWVMGIFLVICTEILDEKFDLLAPLDDYPVVEAGLIFTLFGVSLGFWQWLKLRKLGIPLFKWLLATSIGWGSGAVLWTLLYQWLYYSSWIQELSSVPHFISTESMGIIITGSILIMWIGGAILGGTIVGNLELISLRRFIAKPEQWVRAQVWGLLIPILLAELIALPRRFLKRVLFSLPFFTQDFAYWIVFRGWELVFLFALIMAVLSLSVLTGRVLLFQSNLASPIPEQPGE